MYDFREFLNSKFTDNPPFYSMNGITNVIHVKKTIHYPFIIRLLDFLFTFEYFIHNIFIQALNLRIST